MSQFTYPDLPATEQELLIQCKTIEGLTFAQMAERLNIRIPENPLQRKGWAGQAIERALGANSGSLSQPDFVHLGIELKTLPLKSNRTPAETTFITSIPLLTIHQQQWQTSQCREKLKRILWIPVEGDTAIPFAHRRIGTALLWSPNAEEEKTLASDWQELTTMICTGRLEEIDAGMGQYLQIRPKAAHARSLCYGFDAQGNKIQTLPRGFYLRTSLTRKILANRS